MGGRGGGFSLQSHYINYGMMTKHYQLQRETERETAVVDQEALNRAFLSYSIMIAVRKWFKSLNLHVKLKASGKKLKDIFRIWFPKKDKGFKKKAKQIMKKVAKAQVGLMQSSHYIKQTIAILYTISIVVTMLTTVFLQNRIAAVSERVEKVNETVQEMKQNLTEPGYREMAETIFGTILDIGTVVYSTLQRVWETEPKT